MRRLVTGTRARPVVLVVIAACLVATAAPAVAAASHVQSRFSGPAAFLDPMWESVSKPQVSGTNVVFRLRTWSGDGGGVGLWAIGGALSVVDILAGAGDLDLSGGLTAFARSGDIYVSDGVASYPVCTATGQQIEPRIDGLTIVWQDRRSGTWDIYAATIDGATLAVTSEWAVCAAPRAQTLPDVGGDRIVWEDRRDGEPDVWSRQIGGGETTAVCRNSGPQLEPRTDGLWVVWTDRRDLRYGADVYGRHFGRPVRRLCHGLKGQDQPDVDDGFVVWRDFRSRHARTADDDCVQTSVRGRELSSGDVFVVADPKGQESQLDMDAHTVVWTHYPKMFRDRPWYGLVHGAVLQH